MNREILALTREKCEIFAALESPSALETEHFAVWAKSIIPALLDEIKARDECIEILAKTLPGSKVERSAVKEPGKKRGGWA